MALGHFGGRAGSALNNVGAMGNFGGRAAGFGRPGQNDWISAFCLTSGVDERAEVALRGLPLHLAQLVVAEGPILGNNASAMLMLRVQKAEQLSRSTSHVQMVRSDTVAAARGGDPIAAFVVQYGVDQSAEVALRALPLELQRAVINDGPLRGNNASALLMSRIRKVSAGMSSSVGSSMVSL